MKTKQELLDFYGVEIGKTYKITNTDLMIPGKKIFTIEESDEHYGRLGLKFDDIFYSRSIIILSECCYEEVKPLVLDEKEKEYLQKYVMDNPAFKGKVSFIRKGRDTGNEFLRIILKNGDVGYLPNFKENSMYKNMQTLTDYTPQELGLEE